MPKIKDLGITVVPEQFRPPEIGGGGGCAYTYCTDCTNVPYSICGTTPGAYGCTDCTTQAYSICGTSPGFCTDCTTRPYSICGTTRQWVACRLQSRFPTIFDVTTPCGGSFVGPETIRPGGGGLRLEDIAQLRTQLNEQLKTLDEYEKSLGPQSLEEVDAREKQLTEELARLKNLRSELGKKK
ncbi:MAG TPA: hypothetical protein VF432_31920 [Thermoanaerobaculia bacterium]